MSDNQPTARGEQAFPSGVSRPALEAREHTHPQDPKRMRRDKVRISVDVDRVVAHRLDAIALEHRHQGVDASKAAVARYLLEEFLGDEQLQQRTLKALRRTSNH